MKPKNQKSISTQSFVGIEAQSSLTQDSLKELCKKFVMTPEEYGSILEMAVNVLQSIPKETSTSKPCPQQTSKMTSSDSCGLLVDEAYLESEEITEIESRKNQDWILMKPSAPSSGFHISVYPHSGTLNYGLVPSIVEYSPSLPTTALTLELQSQVRLQRDKLSTELSLQMQSSQPTLILPSIYLHDIIQH